MPQSYSSVYVHLVFSTLERTPWLKDPKLRGEMHSVLGKLTGELGCPSVLVGGVADHVHILARMGRQTCQSDWAKELKRQSTNWVRPRLAEFRWQSGFGAFSVLHRDLAIVRCYIENQEEHHRTKSFQDEFREFFVEHGIEFDERYLWA